ncbi:MAG: UbiA family prenyltransferase [Phycisphaerales bacterium]
MASFADWLRLARISNLPTTWTNVLVGVAVVGTGPTRDGVVVAAASVGLLYIGGMVLNDVLDAPRDADRGLDRPIPAGRIRRSTAGLVAALLLVGGPLLAGFAAGGVAAAWAIGLAACVVAYNTLKERGAAGLLFMGACRGLILPLAASVQRGLDPASSSNWPSHEMWLLAGLAIALAGYVQLVTLAARGEHDAPPDRADGTPAPNRKLVSRWLMPAAVVAPVFAAVATLFGAARDPAVDGARAAGWMAASGWGAAVIATAAAAWFVGRTTRRLRGADPSTAGSAAASPTPPASIPASIMAWLAGICLIDVAVVMALAAVRGGHSGQAFWSAAAAIACFFITRAGHRRIAGS